MLVYVPRVVLISYVLNTGWKYQISYHHLPANILCGQQASIYFNVYVAVVIMSIHFICDMTYPYHILRVLL